MSHRIPASVRDFATSNYDFQHNVHIKVTVWNEFINIAFNRAFQIRPQQIPSEVKSLDASESF